MGTLRNIFTILTSSLASFGVVEVGQTGEVFSRSIESQFPDVDIAMIMFACELLALSVGFDCRMNPIGKDAFWPLYVSVALEKFATSPVCRSILITDAGTLLIASEGHFPVVIVKILRL